MTSSDFDGYYFNIFYEELGSDDFLLEQALPNEEVFEEVPSLSPLVHLDDLHDDYVYVPDNVVESIEEPAADAFLELAAGPAHDFLDLTDVPTNDFLEADASFADGFLEPAAAPADAFLEPANVLTETFGLEYAPVAALPAPIFAAGSASGPVSSPSSGRTITKSPSPEHGSAHVYPPFPGRFKTGDEARAHRRASKRKVNQDPNLASVKKARDDWIRRLYNSIVDTKDVVDNVTSAHRKRFEKAVLDPLDIEATAHHVFDQAVAVHEVGWTRPLIYHKEPVRGKHVDKAKNNCKARLKLLCSVLASSKSACNDALQGGLQLRRLVYNPGQALAVILDNKKNNQEKQQKLAAAKAMDPASKKKGPGRKGAGKKASADSAEQAE